MTYRVVQWTTGNVGEQTALAILASPDLELIGCYAWSETKRDKDIGELLGREAIGIRSTNDIAALLALKPDCVCYNPMWYDINQLCQILEAGVNVAASTQFITGTYAYGEENRNRLMAACEKGGSSMFGSGMHPGFSNFMALATTAACNRVDKITILESQDASGYASAETQRSVGFDSPMDDPDLEAMSRNGSVVFAEGIEMMANALKVDLDDIRFEANYAAATQDNDLGFMRIRKGHVAGVEGHWLGIKDGRVLFDVGYKWKMGQFIEQPWEIDHAYLLEVQGMPTLKLRMEIHPPKDFAANSLQDYMVLGMVITGMPVVNAIPAICQASPGIKTYMDIPITPAAGFCL